MVWFAFFFKSEKPARTTLWKVKLIKLQLEKKKALFFFSLNMIKSWRKVQAIGKN